MINFAERAHNHSYKLDPIVRSLLDTDFYKLLMLQFIWSKYKTVHTTWSVKNRTKSISLTDHVNEHDLRNQLDFVKSLRWKENELVWLAGNKFYGQNDMFKPEFIDYLRNDFKLSDYTLTKTENSYSLTFHGDWAETTLWEIYALSIINELKTRSGFQSMTEFEIDILYSRAKNKLWNKIDLLRQFPGTRIAEFGTRRRHSFLWQEWVTLALARELGSSYTGSSNAFLAFKHGLNAIGTNAHELPMVMACLAETDEELKNSQYLVLQEWMNLYQGKLLVFLPDTFGTTQFLRDAPEWIKSWTGARIDSKNPVVAANELNTFWESRGTLAKNKLCLFSDGLDENAIVSLHKEFSSKTLDAYGWGTMATNDFIDCHPRNASTFNPISLVCKIESANGRGAVKLSDNYTKATGKPEDIERYRKVFGTDGVENTPVFV